MSDLSRFCKLAVRSIIDGENSNQINKAATSLELDEDAVSGAVRALAQILVMLASASKNIVSDKMYKETLVPMKLSDDASTAIYGYYQLVHHQLRDVLRQFTIDTSRYQSLDWRLDIQVGSRSLHHRVDPVFLCELQTTGTKTQKTEDVGSFDSDEKSNGDDGPSSAVGTLKNGTTQNEKTLFECDYANLENMITQFEQALRETRQSWYKKVSRQTK